MPIGNCRVSKILIDGGSSANILYGGALNWMEDSSEAAQVLINRQAQSHLYGFDENETRSPRTISLPVRADPYNIITKFYVESPDNAILERPCVTPRSGGYGDVTATYIHRSKISSHIYATHQYRQELE